MKQISDYMNGQLPSSTVDAVLTVFEHRSVNVARHHDTIKEDDGDEAHMSTDNVSNGMVLYNTLPFFMLLD